MATGASYAHGTQSVRSLISVRLALRVEKVPGVGGSGIWANGGHSPVVAAPCMAWR